MKYPNQRTVLLNLFGATSLRAVVDFPNHISDLVSATSEFCPLTENDWIDRHTLLPAYRLLLTEVDLERARRAMDQGGRQNNVNAEIGLIASRVRRQPDLRFCSECAREDRARVGEPYWHRVHQLPGVIVCPKHNLFLNNLDLKHSKSLPPYAFLALADVLKFDIVGQPIDPKSPPNQILCAVARGALWLLENKPPSLDQASELYRTLLYSRDLITHRGNVRIQALDQFLEQSLGDGVLASLDCGLTRQDLVAGIVDLMRAYRSPQHPLVHLLVVTAFSMNVQSFFSAKKSRVLPFGIAPWPCLNAVCPEHGRRVIKRVETVQARGDGRPIGRFTCRCGFSYIRFGPDRTLLDQQRFDRIQAFGPVWDGQFRSDWVDSSVSLRELQRRFGVDSKTLRKQAQRLGLPLNRPGSRKTHVGAKAIPGGGRFVERDHLSEYRKRWVEARSDNPCLSTTQLRNELPNVFMWLYRHDLRWLQQNNQDPKMQPVRHPSIRVDWIKRDCQLLLQIPAIVRLIKELPGRPKQVTRAQVIALMSGTASIDYWLDKVPETRNELARCVESRETFALRRIDLTRGECLRLGLKLAEWQFVRRAGIRSDLLKECRILFAVQSAVEQINMVSSDRVA